MPATCQAAVPATEYHSGWEECGEPAEDIDIYACMHEHISVKATCSGHKYQPGMVGCRRCWDAGHECEMVLVRRR